MKASAETISPEVQRAEKVVSLLAKAIRAYQVYLPSNRMFTRAFEELTKALRDFCFDNEALTLAVREFDLIYKNHTVYSSLDKMQSIAFKLYRDGIRLISFHSDVTDEELLAFIDALSKAQDHDHIQDDLVTLLWERDLHGITYYEVNQVDISSYQTAWVEKGATSEATCYGPPDIDTARVAEQMKWSSIENEVERIRETLSFTTDEVNQIQQIGHYQHRRSSVRILWQVVLECLRLDRSIECLTDLEPTIVALLDNALASERIGLVNQVLSDLQEIVKDLGGEANQIFMRILDSRTDPAKLSIHSDALSKAGYDDRMDFIRYFSILGEKAIPLLLGVIDQSSGSNALDICTASMAIVASGCPDKLVNRDTDFSERQIEAILEALSRMIGDQAKLASIRFVDHQSPRIRARVAALLEDTNTREAIEALKTLVSDPNPLVKRRAMISLCRNPSNCSSENILGLILSDDFASLPHSSKVTVLMAIRNLQPGVQIEVMRAVLKKRSILGKKKLEDTQIAAVEASTMLSKDVAYEILNEARGKVSKRVARAISQVIKRIEDGD